MTNLPGLVCWNCGTSLQALSLPLRRLEVCPECDSELHVCRLCSFYDPNSIDQCTEEDAEEVRDKERANFCDYYKPRAGAYHARESAEASVARSELNALFGQPSQDSADQSADSSHQELKDLFR